jgi:hypothetical protein
MPRKVSHHKNGVGTLFLGALAREDVGGDRLVDFGGAFNDFTTCFHVERFDLDDLLAVDHAGVREFGLEACVGEDHVKETDFKHRDSLGVILSSKSLDEFTSRGRRPHSVGDGPWKRGVHRDIRIDVDRVVIRRDVRVRSVVRRRNEISREDRRIWHNRVSAILK